MNSKKHDPDLGWVLHVTDSGNYSPVAIANGKIGLVSSWRGLQFEQTILNGVYDKYGPDNVSRIMSGIHFANLDLQVDGDSVSAAQHLDGWQQDLNMKEACLTTRFIFASKVQVEHRLYALRHLPHSVLITLTLTALENVSVTLKHSISVPPHLKPQTQFFRFHREVPDTPIWSSTALSPTGRHQLSAALGYLFTGEMPQLTHHSISDREHAVEFNLELSQGASYHFGVVGSICTTAHFADPGNEAERLSIFAKFEGEERLIARHFRAWEALWEGDIIVEGDPQAQRDIRFALYNLYSFVRAGSRLSVPPMGLSSTDYNGHIFWDSELWMYPPLLVLHPDLARSFLDYRFDRLHAARRRASNYGFQGAMYPWESDDTGEECTPTWAAPGVCEQHITACIGIAHWDYYRVTGDKVWLQTHGYPVLEQVAQFWVGRADKNELGQYEIKNVVGADEYTGVVNNDAFTNGAAIIALRYATLAAQELGKEPDPQWRSIADSILILTFEDETTQEYEGYDGRTVKEADVNLLAYPLNLVTSEARIRKDLDYYEPRFDEDAPAMSHSILAVISARLGDRERAHELFKRSYQPNQKTPFGVLSETPHSGNPYFATAAGGMLQAVLFGFGGLIITERGLVHQQPCLPASWKSLTIKGIGIQQRILTITS